MVRLTRRDLLKWVVASLATMAFGATLPAAETRSARPPNIIFIMVDDLGIGDVGCYGQERIQTPVMDRMAREGARFTDCYTGSPVCAPSRCVLMTGLHSGHCRRRDNKTRAHKDGREATNGLLPLAKDDVTIAAMLKQAGYVTGGFGKWGLGNPGTTGTPDQHGFDLFYGYLDQVHAHNYYTDHLYRNRERESVLVDGKPPYSHHLIADETLKFIRDNKDKPFFCYVPWTLPHSDYVVPDQGIYADKPWSDKLKNYAAMVSLIDADLGRVLELLKELDIDEDTIVFFTSDNGPNKPFLKPFNSNGPYRGIKRQLYEGGIRMPMIVRWPGHVPAGTTSDFPWAFTDVMPTAAALAGITPPDHMDGISVLPTLLGQEQEPQSHLYWEFHNPFHQAVRMGTFKGIRFGTQAPMQLYDLSRDPGEKRDIADRHPAVCERMAEIMLAEHKETPYWPIPKTSGRKKRK